METQSDQEQQSDQEPYSRVIQQDPGDTIKKDSRVSWAGGTGIVISDPVDGYAMVAVETRTGVGATTLEEKPVIWCPVTWLTLWQPGV